MRVEREFLSEEFWYTYRLIGAPDIEGVGSARLTVAARQATIHVEGGRIQSVTVSGHTVRRDGRPGVVRSVVFGWREWGRAPEWLTEIVASIGVPLEEVRS